MLRVDGPTPPWASLDQTAKTREGEDVIIRYDSIMREIHDDDLGHRTGTYLFSFGRRDSVEARSSGSVRQTPFLTPSSRLSF